MAQRVQVILEDDYDGSEADETVTFALEGVEYEIDLSAENADSLRNSLAPWVAHARRVGGRRRRVAAKAATSSASSSTTSDIRAWAQENGYEVSSRGRVSSEIREAYEQAHA
ncbi:MAG TPA: Lsr2 family protein [Microlunatus sp.]|nr:Lsr2 family protein [Microlunatus sp.]